jgi:hypothetical protein
MAGRQEIASERFYTDAAQPADLTSSSASFFLRGGIMSMQHRWPIKVVCAEPAMMFVHSACKR